MRILTMIFLLFVFLITNAQSIFDKESVKALMDKVNNYKYENPWKDFDDNWIQGTYYAQG